MQNTLDMLGSYWAVWMMILFVGIVIWAFLPSNKRRFERDANIIFNDDEEKRN